METERLPTELREDYRNGAQLSYDDIADGAKHVAGSHDHALSRAGSQLSYDSIASSTAGGNDLVPKRSLSEDHALNKEGRGSNLGSKNGNKKGIKTILKKFHKGKKDKSHKPIE